MNRRGFFGVLTAAIAAYLWPDEHYTQGEAFATADGRPFVPYNIWPGVQTHLPSPPRDGDPLIATVPCGENVAEVHEIGMYHGYEGRGTSYITTIATKNMPVEIREKVRFGKGIKTIEFV